MPGKSHRQGSLAGYSPCGCKRVGHSRARVPNPWASSLLGTRRSGQGPHLAKTLEPCGFSRVAQGVSGPSSSCVWQKRVQNVSGAPMASIIVFRSFCRNVFMPRTRRTQDQSCPTLSDPMDYSLPGSFIHGVFQARLLEWGAIALSNASTPIVLPRKSHGQRSLVGYSPWGHRVRQD